MKMTKLDVTNIQTVKALHIYLAYMLELPAHYGKNLDALHDALTEDCEERQIVLEGQAASEEMMAYLPRLEAVLCDSAEENDALAFKRV